MKKWKELAEKPREEVENELSIDTTDRRHSLIQYGEHTDEELSDSSDMHDETQERESMATDGDTEISLVSIEGPSKQDDEQGKAGDAISEITTPVH